MPGIFRLGYLFYPWGFIVQLVALVHFFRRRPDGFWLWVIFFGGFLGASVYIVAEMLPDVGLLRKAYEGYGRRSRIALVETAILDNPSAANLEELGELYWDEKQFAKAQAAFDRAIATRSDSPHCFYRRGLCLMALGQPAAALPDFQRVLRDDRKFDSYRAQLMLAEACAATGQEQQAAALFAEVVQHSNTPETLYTYAAFLQSQHRNGEAREWAEQLLQRRRTLPRHWQRVERPWFRKGQALLKKLSAS
ncbi:MAG TPA: tetratricopeptide repeat protein [Candidatus Acidoferrales bacterium]|nr:tetratricopeptide repeat protein [Candidatus Acidoferrales bacterium]